MNAAVEEQNTCKTYVNEEDKATIICPICSAAKTISVEVFRDKMHTIKVKCSCGHSFRAALEFRKNFRKQTSLMASYTLQPPSGVEKGRGKVHDLSLSGVSFDVRNILHEIKPGTKGTIELTLDDRKQSEIVRKVIVRSVNKSRIGCEFIDDVSSKELGFYMLSL